MIVGAISELTRATHSAEKYSQQQCMALNSLH